MITAMSPLNVILQQRFRILTWTTTSNNEFLAIKSNYVTPSPSHSCNKIPIAWINTHVSLPTQLTSIPPLVFMALTNLTPHALVKPCPFITRMGPHCCSNCWEMHFCNMSVDSCHCLYSSKKKIGYMPEQFTKAKMTKDYCKWSVPTWLELQ